MNKDRTGIFVYVALILCAGVLIAEYVTATRDISWIDEVEDFIKKEDWVPNSEYIPLQDWAFFLYENETEQYFYLTNQKEFISHIDNILNRVNRQVEESISEDLLDEILATGFSFYSHCLMSPRLPSVSMRLSLSIPRTTNSFFSESFKIASPS